MALAHPPSYGPQLELRTTHLRSGIVEVRVEGEVDLAGGKRLQTLLTEIGRADRPVLVNLSTCTFIDSTGLSALIRASRAVDAPPLALCCPPEGTVRRLFTLTRAKDLLPLHDSRAAAIESLRRSSADSAAA